MVHFRIKQEKAYSDLKKIKAEVPQSSVLGPILYLLYTYDIPKEKNATGYACRRHSNTSDSVSKITSKLQISINKVNAWIRKWRIKLNESKSIHVNYINRN